MNRQKTVNELAFNCKPTQRFAYDKFCKMLKSRILSFEGVELQFSSFPSGYVPEPSQISTQNYARSLRMERVTSSRYFPIKTSFQCPPIKIYSVFYSTGYPELGFLAKLPSDISQTSSGWKKISGWVTTLTGVKGLYNFEADYSSNGNINITVSGLFFASVSIPVSNADVGKFFFS